MTRATDSFRTSSDHPVARVARRRVRKGPASLRDAPTRLPTSVPKEQWYVQHEVDDSDDFITHCESCGAPFTPDGYEQVTPRGARVMREYFRVGGNGMPRRKVCPTCWHRPRVAPSVAEFM